MKLVLSTIIVGIVLFLLGGLLFSFLFVDYFKSSFGGMMRSDADLKLWAFAAGSLTRAFFMYIIYSKGYQGGSPFMEGLRFGFWIGLFFAAPYVFLTWGGTPIHYQPVVLSGVLNLAMIMIAGILTGIIHGKNSAKHAA